MAMTTKYTQQGRLASGGRVRLMSTKPSVLVKRSVVAQAQATKSGFAQWANSVGLPTDQGVFGFTPFAEMWVGRWAQIGFVSSVVNEFVTGRGTLQQIGLPGDSAPMLVALLVLFGGGSLAGTFRTLQRALTKEMSKPEAEGYRTFLGLNQEQEIQKEAARMKQEGDFTTPGNNEAAIAASKAAGSPADTFLSLDDEVKAQQAAQGMKSASSSLGTSPAAGDNSDVSFGQQGELAYARGIELINGRAAMLGFLTAIIVEAATGQGVIGQCISICKWSGLLGDKSGF